MSLKVVHVDIGSVQPAAYNPRAISDEAFAGLVASIKKFGVVRPLVVNRTTGNLVGGHQTRKACLSLGHKTVPVTYVELDEPMEKALNITLNNPHISGHYTDDLQMMIAELRAEIGEDYLTELRLDPLEVDLSWESDIGKVSDVDENTDGIVSIIKVHCPQERKDEVLAALKAFVLQLGIEGVGLD